MTTTLKIDADNFGYPRASVLGTMDRAEAFRAANQPGRSFILRAAPDPAANAYVDWLCTDSSNWGILHSLHKLILTVTIDEKGRIVANYPKKNDKKLPCVSWKKSSFELARLLPNDGAPLMPALRQQVIDTREIVKSQIVTMLFRTKEEYFPLFHEDITGDTLTRCYSAESTAEFGEKTSFARVKTENLEEKQYARIEGKPTYRLDRRDMALLRLPHRPGTSRSDEEFEFGDPQLKHRFSVTCYRAA